MPKTTDELYNKILRDVNKHISGSNKINYINSEGIQTESIFQRPPTPDELEGLLLWLNKETLPQA